MAYDLETLKAPRSTGALLRLFVGLAESGATGGLLAEKFFKDIGVATMRATPAEAGPPAEHPVLAAARSAKFEPRDPAIPPAPGKRVLPFETAGDFVAAYEAGTITPSEVAERVLAWTEASNALQPPLRSVIAQHADDVRAQAAAATDRYRQGEPLGPLDGVPIGVKDELDLAGYPTKVGTRFLGTEPAAEDAHVVAQLRAAGAVLIGKLNMHEIGLGVTGVNPHHGAARNPYDLGRATGGSSSGPANAVAAGLCPIAVGADGGGSVRVPAALCGVVGLKATFGRISEHGAAPLCWSVAHVGPLAASARDCAIAYLAMAGPDERDPNTLPQPPVTLDRFDDEDLRGLRLGIYDAWFDHADGAIVEACRRVVDELVARGAEVVAVEIPELALLRSVHLVTICSEMAAAHDQFWKSHRKDYGLDTRLNLALTRRMRNADYVHAQRLRRRIGEHFDAALARCDVIVTPATARTAPPIPADSLGTGESNLENTDLIMRFAPAGNLTGLPALACPAGYDADGLPIGIQFMGRAWSEDLLLRLANVTEGFVERRPPRIHRRLLVP